MARTPVAVVASDWHLAPGAWKKNQSIQGDAYQGLRQAVDLAVERRVPLVAPGDLFDVQHPDAMSLYIARKALDYLHDHGLTLYHVQGQHEYHPTVPVLNAISPHPVHAHKVFFRLGSLKCVGLDYMAPEALRAEFQDMGVREGADLLVTHQVWKNLVPWRHNAPSFADIPYPVTVSGDWHRYGVYDFAGPAGPGRFISPGTLCLQALDEDPRKVVLVLYDDMSFDPVALVTRPFHSVVVETVEGLEAVVADAERLCYHPPDLHPTVQKPIVRVRYADCLPEANSRLAAAFGAAHAFLEPFKLGDELGPAAEPVGPMGNQALQTCLASLRDPATPAYRDVIRLLDAADVPAEIARIESQFQVPAAEDAGAP